MERQGRILVVDDNDLIRDPVMILLELQGYTVFEADSGLNALEAVQTKDVDLILLDIMMPDMDGYDTLKRLKEDPDYRHIPVVMLSAVDTMSSIVRCVELGAEDYLFKPFDKVLLEARVRASLQKKRWHDQEKQYLQQIEIEREKSEQLLLNILPKPISERLKRGEKIIADHFQDATVLFADIVNFTPIAAELSPKDVVQLLNKIFSTFDKLVETYQLEKIKTIGDSYMVVSGIPVTRKDHAEAIAKMALAMQEKVKTLSDEVQRVIKMRIGISSGPVMAGVIGRKKFAYDLWGDTVNTASRMEAHGLPDRIQVSEMTYERLKNSFSFEFRGPIEIKGKGQMPVYILLGENKE